MIALVLTLVWIWARHAIIGEWPGPRYAEWVYPLWPQRIGDPRARFAWANPYCVRRGGHWVPRVSPWPEGWDAWDPPMAPVILIGRPPARPLARAA